jgi:hypothetical protein|nr:MAG TPA: putative DNA-binding domain protein [Caudoviricetes sp.]
MSQKEQLLQLIDDMPEYKIGYVLAYVQGITADEDDDDEFCENLYQHYLNSEDKDESFSFDECKKEWGLD